MFTTPLPEVKRSQPFWVNQAGWRILTDAASTAGQHMAADAAIAAVAIPTARFFTWKDPAISLGLKQPAPEWVKTQAWEDSGFACVERPTAGGVAFHGSDVSIGVVIPRSFDLSLETLMHAVGLSTVRLCESFGIEARTIGNVKGASRITYCLTEPSSYAVFAGSRKVAGFAVRRFPQTWLVEGSLLVRSLPQALTQLLPETVLARLDAYAVSLAEASGRPVAEEEVVIRWAEDWSHWWQESLLCQWTNGAKA